MGGGGNSGSTKWEPPEYTKQGWQDYLTGVQNLSQQPYQQYPGQQVAEQNPYQQVGFDLATQRAMYGAPDLNAARGSMTDIVSGKYLNSNPWLANDYTNKVIADTAGNMGNAFALGTAAQNDALAARQGAYGGSAWQNKQQADAQGLANQVGQMANQYQLARTNLGASDYNTGINQMLQAANTTGTLAQDDWTAVRNMLGIGDINRQYEQDLLNANYNDWQQAQQYPFTMADLFGNALSRASGSYGSNTMVAPGSSPWTNAAGIGLGLYGLLGGGR